MARALLVIVSAIAAAAIATTAMASIGGVVCTAGISACSLVTCGCKGRCLGRAAISVVALAGLAVVLSATRSITSVGTRIPAPLKGSIRPRVLASGTRINSMAVLLSNACRLIALDAGAPNAVITPTSLDTAPSSAGFYVMGPAIASVVRMGCRGTCPRRTFNEGGHS